MRCAGSVGILLWMFWWRKDKRTWNKRKARALALWVYGIREKRGMLGEIEKSVGHYSIMHERRKADGRGEGHDYTEI